MIRLTRLGGEPFILNADMIRYVEERPDTFVTLTGGERVIVVESMEEVMGRAIEYQQTKHLLPPVPCAAGDGNRIRADVAPTNQP
jgi:flagellar protein FlbD